MAKNSRVFLMMSLAMVCLLSISAANRLQAALNSMHCEVKGYNFTLKVAGCQERSVTINYCKGSCTCLSLSTSTGAKYEQMGSCTCCQPIKTEEVKVGFWCQNKADPSKPFMHYEVFKDVTECACASC